VLWAPRGEQGVVLLFVLLTVVAAVFVAIVASSLLTSQGPRASAGSRQLGPSGLVVARRGSPWAEFTAARLNIEARGQAVAVCASLEGRLQKLWDEHVVAWPRSGGGRRADGALQHQRTLTGDKDYVYCADSPFSLASVSASILVRPLFQPQTSGIMITELLPCPTS
jgi:hypothetical protein